MCNDKYRKREAGKYKSGVSKLITKKEDAWITEFIPQYTPKGSRLYHRKSSLPPKQRYMAEFFDRFKDEGVIASETEDATLTAMNGGFMTTFYEKDGKWQGLGYRRDLRGADIELKTPFCPSRRDAGGILDSYIRAYNK